MMPTNLLDIKQQLLQQCRFYVEQRIDFASLALEESREEADEEMESKTATVHESGRSMTQVKKQKNEHLLNQAKTLQKVLDHIDPEDIHQQVKLGSLVITSQGTFLVAIGIGKIEHNKKTYFVISPSSPLGLKLIGCKKDDTITFLNKDFLIKEIV